MSSATHKGAASRAAALTDLTACVVEGKPGGDFAGIVRQVTEAFDAWATVLWEVAPGVKWDEDPPRGRLFALAGWTKAEVPIIVGNLQLHRSIVGEAVINQQARNVGNIWSDPHVASGVSLLKEYRVRSMAAVPVTYADQSRGAISLYRQEGRPPFTESALRHLEEWATRLPHLLKIVRDRDNLELIGKIDSTLKKAEPHAPTGSLSTEQMRAVLSEVCRLVADTFFCLEVSTIFEDRLDCPGAYRIMATTWDRVFDKTGYRKDETDGITGWMLFHARPVRIVDLAQFERDKDEIQNEYPGLTWRDPLNLRRTVREKLDLKVEDELPPLSNMAVPIRVAQEVVGVVRCTALKSWERGYFGPYFFSKRDQDLLVVVAGQLSRFWSNWLRHAQIQAENKSWQTLVEKLSELNRFAHEEFTQREPRESRIFDKALEVMASVIRGADILDLRLLDADCQELYFANTCGEAWGQGNQEEINARLNRRYGVGDAAPRSIGKEVFRTRRVYTSRDTTTDPNFAGVFPNLRRNIAAPVLLGDKVFGILDICGTGPHDFPTHAPTAAELMGRQLGLYYELGTTIRSLNDTLRELSRKTAEQTGFYQDLSHQLKGPIMQAYRRAEIAVQRSNGEDRNLLAIRGLCRKARRTTVLMRLLADLLQGKPIRTEAVPLKRETLVPLLIEAAEDNQLMVDPRRSVGFSVVRDSFPQFALGTVRADPGLLGQAIDNIMDNAGKYSLANTDVRIYGHRTKGGRFSITVENKGIKLRPDEVSRCAERGWRGDWAKTVTGEGSGIGLWIVEAIMRAHGGDLVITPSDHAGVTRVSLVFTVD